MIEMCLFDLRDETGLNVRCDPALMGKLVNFYTNETNILALLLEGVSSSFLNNYIL